MVKPVEGWLIQRFNFEEDTGYKNHEGIDIDSGIDGKDVIAAADGTVVYVNREDSCAGGAGLWVWIWHGEIVGRNGNRVEKISTRYLHLKDIPQEIQPGTKVYGGKTVIGKVSNTGDWCWYWPFRSHLHFETRQNGNPEDMIAGKIGYKQTIPLNPLRFVEYEDRSKKPNSLTISVHSPVDLIVIDPDDFIVSKDINELPETSWYFEMPIDEEGNPGYEFIAVDERKTGDYLVKIIPEPEALPTDIYTLEVLGEGVTIVLAEDVPISNIPRRPYIIRLTETEIFPIVPAFVDFDPGTLNLKSKGKYVTVYVELPPSYDVNEINLKSIKLNNQIPIEPKPTEIGDYDGNSILDLMVKFQRSAVQSILEVREEVKITISGKLNNERLFEGSDIIRAIK